MTIRQAHVFIQGRVQGVYFRESTRKKAVALGLSGYVRNLSDGRVEAFFQGEEHAVGEALDFVAHGPPQAHVDQISVSDAPQKEERPIEESFEVLPTGVAGSS